MWTHNKYIETDQEERGRGREGGRVMDSTERERERVMDSTEREGDEGRETSNS